MQIFWQGYSSVRMEAKQGETACRIMTDPFENESSIRFPRSMEPDVLLLSHQDRSRFNIAGVAGSPFVISDPGEYELRGVFFYGIQDTIVDTGKKRSLCYRIEAEDLALGFLGQLHRPLTDAELETLGNIDILFIPVGGESVLDAKIASKVISSVEPRIIVPIFYQIPGLKTKLDSVDSFCSAMGGCRREQLPKLKLSKKDLPAEDVFIAVIERS